MKPKPNLSGAMLVIATAALGIVVPYLIAWRISPDGTVFTGFLMNPVDGFSYLAKMRQGYTGSWLFRLPYAAEPGSGALLFVFYILLGHFSRVLNLPLIVTYHFARLVFSCVFFLTLYVFFNRLFDEPRRRWSAFVLSLFGSGFGWFAALTLGRQSIDLNVPEAIPFLTAYTNPHFPLAAAAFLGSIILVFEKGRRDWWHWVLAIASGFTIGAVLPFVTITLACVLGGWIIWELIRERAWTKGIWLREAPLSAAAVALGALPWLVYDYWLSQTHPAISQWNAQNLTPSPALIDTVLGFGWMLPLALLCLRSQPWKDSRAARLFIVWSVLGLALLYAPLPFQRRLSMGLFIPLTGLSVLYLDERVEDPARFRTVRSAILASTLPSLLLVIVVGVAGAASGNEAIVYSDSELAIYRWIRANLPSDSMILAEPRFGNRLPAHALVRVLYGHPFETPQADRWRTIVDESFDPSEPASNVMALMNDMGVDYVLFRESSQEQDPPGWLTGLSEQVTIGNLNVLENPTR